MSAGFQRSNQVEVTYAKSDGNVQLKKKRRSAQERFVPGVSNFTVRDTEDLFHVPQDDRCATNQVLYSQGDPTLFQRRRL
jgi:diketogulonate reductase-like aldo/keto reductase